MKNCIFIIWLILTFSIQSYAQNSSCPVVSVLASSNIPTAEEFVTFTASVKVENNNKIGYKWTISGGKIEAGQGTQIIEVKSDTVDFGDITATVEIIGLPVECKNTASASIQYFICGLPITFKTDEFSIETSRIDKLRLDIFFAELEKDPTSQINIIEKFDISVSRSQVKLKLRELFLYFKAKNIPSERVTVFLSKDDKTLTEFWVRPAGAEFLECDKCKIVSSEDIESVLNKLFPKKSVKKSKPKMI